MTLDSIIERLEKATGPDRWLDAQIHGIHRDQKITVNEGGMVLTDYCVLGWIDPGKESVNFNPSGIGERMLRYTESVDAAIALAEKVLPGRTWGFLPNFYKTHPYAASIGSADKPTDLKEAIIEPGHTPAIALCLAILKAKQMGVGE